MNKYVCDVCGYIYDPAVGDPDANIKPGTPFEKLPGGLGLPDVRSRQGQLQPGLTRRASGR